MYLLDPQSGKRRRAYTRDKITHFAKEAERIRGLTLRDLRNRYRGILADATALPIEEVVPDDVLAERVRTVLGRIVSHPGSIDVLADAGTITLSGSILASDQKPLFQRVLWVRGVREVQSNLQVFKSAAHVSGLQGGVPRQARFQLMQTNWSPTARLFSVIGGSAAAFYGSRRHDVFGIAAALAGMAFAARGITNVQLRRLLGITPREPAELTAQKTVYVEAPLEKTLSMWANLHNLPRFLPGIKDVRDIGDGRSNWTMLIDDTPVYWESVIVVSNKALTWKTQPGAPLANSGTIRLDPAAAGTRVQVTLSCRPSRGLPNRIATHWFGPDLSRYLAESLAGMKRIIEREVALPEEPPAERTGS
jgi:uncharacterized membrane protein